MCAMKEGGIEHNATESALISSLTGYDTLSLHNQTATLKSVKSCPLSVTFFESDSVSIS